MRAVGFSETTVDSTYTGESYGAITPPETVLGIYAEDSLAAVLPCLVDGREYGVEAFLSDLVAEMSDPAPSRPIS